LILLLKAFYANPHLPAPNQIINDNYPAYPKPNNPTQVPFFKSLKQVPRRIPIFDITLTVAIFSPFGLCTLQRRLNSEARVENIRYIM
jgi:hypothetical protein